MQLWLQAYLTENRDPDYRSLKLRDFVADGGREGIVICVVVEDNMDAPLGKKNRSAGL